MSLKMSNCRNVFFTPIAQMAWMTSHCKEGGSYSVVRQFLQHKTECFCCHAYTTEVEGHHINSADLELQDERKM